VEGYTARDALILMRMDLTESLHEVQLEISELTDTLEFSGIAEQLLRDNDSLVQYAAIRRWLEIVANRSDLERDLEELTAERDDLISALEHLEERLTGKKLT
jgi:chromosome segregation ATPase